MKVIKPLRQGLLFKPFEFARRPYLCVAVFTYFAFDNPDQPLLESEMWPFFQGEMGKEALLDEVMPKGASEVLLIGSCFAPRGEPVERAEVSLSMGPVQKELAVSGDRTWFNRGNNGLLESKWNPGQAEPFDQMPLTWDRAFGGGEFAYNPLGKGYLPQDQQPKKEGSPLPNLEYPQQMMAGPWAVPSPACFGPIDIMWPQRQAKVGTYDMDYAKRYYPGLVPDTDWHLFNRTQEDQQREGAWRPREEFSLKGMHPQKEILQGRLTDIRSRCFIQQQTPESLDFRELEMALDTVWLFPAAEKGITVYRGSIPVATDDASDVLHLLLSYEHSGGQSRSLEDYRRSLELRLDKEERIYWLPREDDLAPPEQAPPDQYIPPDPQDDPRVQKFIADMKAQVDEQTAKVEKVMLKLGLEPKEYLKKFDIEAAVKKEMAQMPPLPPEFKGLQDLPMILSYIRQLKAHPAAQKIPAPELERQIREKVESGRQKLFENIRDLMKKEGFSFERKDFDAALAKASAGARQRKNLSVAQKMEQTLAKFRDQPETAGRQEVHQKMDEVLAKAKAFDSKMKKYGLAEKARKSAVKAAAMGPTPELPPPAELDQARKMIEAGYPKGESFAGSDLTGVDLSGLKLAGIDLKEAILDSAKLSGCDLSGAELSGACLARADLGGAKLTGAKLSEASLGKAKAAKADFSRALLDKAQLAQADFSQASFKEADLSQANLMQAVLKEADLSGAKAEKAMFIESDLSGAKLGKATLIKAKFINASFPQADFSEAVLAKAVLVGAKGPQAVFRQADMSNICLVGGADFSGADCSGCRSIKSNWRNCVLEGALFAKSVLDQSDFSEAKLAKAVLAGASAKDARFMKSDLSGADLSRANLFKSSLRWAKLNQADLRYANCYSVDAFRAEIEGLLLEGANLKMSKFGGGDE